MAGWERAGNKLKFNIIMKKWLNTTVKNTDVRRKDIILFVLVLIFAMTAESIFEIIFGI